MRPPSQWAEAERALRQAYATDPGSLPTQPVTYCWWFHDEPSESFSMVPATLGAMVAEVIEAGVYRRRESAAIRRGGLPPANLWGANRVAIYGLDSQAAALPTVTFEIDAGTFEAPSGAANGTLVGELEPNGAMVLETADGRAIWPVYNPTAPTSHAPRRPAT